MRILYLGRFSLPHSTELYVTEALRSQEVEVKCIDIRRSSFRGVRWHVKKFRPHLILFSKPHKHWFKDLMDWCVRSRLLTVTWFWDLWWGHRSNLVVPPQFFANLLFSTDGGHGQDWEERGMNHEVLRQGIHKPDHVYFDADPKFDVAFVGTSYGMKRKRMLKFLYRTYDKRFFHFTNCRGLDLNRALATVKVIVGDSHGVDNYWSNRIYEVTGRGGFLLHPATLGLDDEFVDGVHYVSYEHDNLESLKDRIDYWVEKDDERERIRRQGFDHCGAHFTYDDRVSVLISRIRETPSL